MNEAQKNCKWCKGTGLYIPLMRAPEPCTECQLIEVDMQDDPHEVETVPLPTRDVFIVSGLTEELQRLMDRAWKPE